MGRTEQQEVLQDPEQEKPQRSYGRPTRSRGSKVAAIVGTLTVAAFLLYSLYSHNISQPPTTHSYVSPTCGNSSSEARARGCHYEPMLRSWIPDDCYTPEPGDEYTPFDDRAWFYDKNLTQPILGSDLDVLRNGDDITAFTRFFHDEHCLYAWRKLHLAVAKRLPLIDSKTMSLHHSTHCSQRIARFIQEVHTYVWNDSHTGTAPLMFQTCVPLFL
jgi:hypothetical protein